jgi:mycoredoxin
MSQKVILYGKPWCPMVGPAQRSLQALSIDFEYVDILQDSQAMARVREINNGLESVPTLVFSDGSTLTEPSNSELRAKLVALGYPVPRPTVRHRTQALLDNPLIRFSGLLFLGIGVFSANNVLVGVGVVILALALLSSRFARGAGQSSGSNP